MSNFNGTARSNYFRVKDADAFVAAMVALPDIKVWTKVDDNGVVRHAIASDDADTGCWPGWMQVESMGEPGGDEIEEDREIYMPDEIAPHLMDGEVCVLMEAGAEKLRYISAYALAFDNTDREVVRVSLNDIYHKAKDAFGVEPTDATY
jgi:hypothetical protein